MIPRHPVPTDAGDVLAFWRDEVGPDRWYASDPALDAEIARRFAPAIEAAAAGRLDAWLAEPEGALALVLLLDQFPRNAWRGTARAFAQDARGNAIAQRAIAMRHDRRIAPELRQFFYLPLMHSEALPHQERCVRLIQFGLADMPKANENLEHARRHRDVIRRFGRFPSRNAPLGRADTEAERAYREAGGYMG